MPAIAAAALALSSTPVFAQETVQPAQPVAVEPAPATIELPAPAPTEPAATTDISSTPETSTSAPATTAKRSVQRTAVRTTRVSAAKPTPITARTTARTVAQTALPASAAAVPPVAVAPAPAPAFSTATPAPANTPTVKPVDGTDETLPIAAGGALALLALGGTAVALTRRRRREELADEEPTSYDLTDTMVQPQPEPIIHEEQSMIVAPSAFAWGSMPQANEARANESSSNESSNGEDDRRPGESWVERAYRGPSSGNPSASLRNRLKRAAFFDKREREAAAGLAEPVDASAGLPDAMVEEQERELA
ncbi:MAG: hypothetical protein ABI770_02330 [Sphingomicrobium sp.]